MLTNTFEFWEKEWKAVSFDDTCEMFIVFLLHMPKSMCHPQQKHTFVQQNTNYDSFIDKIDPSTTLKREKRKEEKAVFVVVKF